MICTLPLPRIQHNTLYTVKMHNVIMSRFGTFEDLLATHLQSRLYLEIDHCQSDFVVNSGPDPFIAISKMNLLSLVYYGNLFETSSGPVLLLNTTLTEIAIGWKDRSPELALAFATGRASSPSEHLRSLRFRGVSRFGSVSSDDCRSWKAVRELGKSHGISLEHGR